MFIQGPPFISEGAHKPPGHHGINTGALIPAPFSRGGLGVQVLALIVPIRRAHMRLQKKRCEKCGRRVGVRKDGTYAAHKPRKGSKKNTRCK